MEIVGLPLNPPEEYDEVLTAKKRPLMNSFAEVERAEWPEVLEKNYFGVHYNRGVVSEALDAEQVKTHLQV